jgi:hypothetical protein
MLCPVESRDRADAVELEGWQPLYGSWAASTDWTAGRGDKWRAQAPRMEAMLTPFDDR